MSNADLAVGYARAQIGKGYRFAAQGPDYFDCSGLTKMAWQQAGLKITPYSLAQAAETQHAPIAEAQPGDLLFWYSPISHVAIVSGPNMLIEAYQTGKPIHERHYDNHEDGILSFCGKMPNAGVLTDANAATGPAADAQQAGASLNTGIGIVDNAKAFADGFSSVASALGSKALWQRIGFGAAGALILITMLYWLSRRTITKAARNAIG